MSIRACFASRAESLAQLLRSSWQPRPTASEQLGEAVCSACKAGAYRHTAPSVSRSPNCSERQQTSPNCSAPTRIVERSILSRTHSIHSQIACRICRTKPEYSRYAVCEQYACSMTLSVSLSLCISRGSLSVSPTEIVDRSIQSKGAYYNSTHKYNM
jgi:hypothetical protein